MDRNVSAMGIIIVGGGAYLLTKAGVLIPIILESARHYFAN